MSAPGRRLAALFAGLCTLGACATGQSVYQPPSSQAYANILVGRLADLRQDHAASAAQFAQALAATPGDPAVQDGALAAALAVGDLERARSASRVAVAQDTHVAYARFVPAVDALAAGRWRQARQQLALAQLGVRSEPIRRILNAWTDVGAARIDPALEGLSGATSSRAYNALMAQQRALALDAAGRDAAARLAYEEALRSGLWSTPMGERYADLLVRTGASATGAEMLRAREGRFGNPAALAAAARIEAGGAAANEPLTPARGAAIGLYALGGMFIEEGDFTNGLATLTLSLMLDPKLDAARIAFAEAKIDLGQTQAASAALAQIDPQSPYALNAKLVTAYIAVRERRMDDALAIARDAQASGGARAQRALADLYRAAERFGDAEPIYSELIASAPAEEPLWPLYFSRGVARERLGRWSEAEADFRAALALSPDQPDILNYLGYSLIDKNLNLHEGLELIERAAALRPGSGAIIDSLGWAYYRLGDYERAVELLERAVSLAPSDATLNDHLGDVYWRLGRRIEARFQWRRALGLEPDRAMTATLEQKLERGLQPTPGARSASR